MFYGNLEATLLYFTFYLPVLYTGMFFSLISYDICKFPEVAVSVKEFRGIG
jgi:hypothetical protein